MLNKLTAAKPYAVFLLPLVLLLPGMTSFIFPGSGAAFSDMAVTHYPNALFLQNALRQGVVPLWSSQILSGFPFVAHPYSGLWYPPYWLALLFPLPLGLNLVLAAHVVLAGVGMYAFLRQQGCAHAAALLGGLVFQLAPRLFAHIGAGHLMLVMAVCLTPWLLWASRSPRLPAALVLALIVGADPRWGLYAGALWAAWLLWQRRPRYLLQQAGMAALLALPALWLYLQYGSLSTRANLSPAEVLELSLPPAQLLGLLLPQWSSAHEWVIYAGVVLLLLVLLARPWQRGIRFWMALLIVCVLVALGSNIPGAQWLAELPGASQLRIPPRALLLASLAWAVLAAGAAQQLAAAAWPQKPLRLLHAAVLAWLLSFAALAAWQGAQLGQPAMFAAALVLAAWLAHERWRSGRVLLLALSVLVAADLLVASGSLLRFRPADSVLAEGAEAAQYLAQDDDIFRVYTPDHSLPQQTAALYGLELANGVDPLQLHGYSDLMAKAAGYSQSGYSVALPPLDVTAQSDAVLLGRLNIKYLVAAQPMNVEGLELLLEEPYVYLNSHYRPRAWMEQGGEAQRVPLLDVQANRMTLHAYGPGQLNIAELQYPGWHVLRDRQPAEFAVPGNVLRRVVLPAGEHEIELYFMPDALRFGLPVTALAWLVMLWRVFRRQA